MPIVYWGGDIPDGDPVLSAATPGLWNRRFSALSQSIDFLNASGFTAGGVYGTANQITATPSSATSTRLSLPSDLRAPGSLLVTSDTSLNSTLTVAGATRLASTLSVGDEVKSAASVHVGSDISMGRTFYITLPIIAGSSSTKPWRFSDTNMGFYRSVNSLTLRFAGPTGSNATFYIETPMRVASGFVESTMTFTEQVFSGVGGSVGGYAFGFAGTGMQQGSNGAVNFFHNASTPKQGFGLTSQGSMFVGPSALPGSRLSFQINCALSVLTTGTSLNSSTLTQTQLAFFIGGASGASIGINSGGTIYWFDSSGSTKG